MDPADRVVTRLPLSELFDKAGPVSARRLHQLDERGVRDRLRDPSTRFVVARGSEPLVWLNSGEETFGFWKTEVRPRLWPPEQFGVFLEELPGERAWVASLWALEGHASVVVFEEHH